MAPSASKRAGEPLRALVCNCFMCQRATRSAFSSDLVFSKADVAFLGEPHGTYVYRSPEHGRTLQFDFCAHCGTKVGLTLERFPGVQLIYTGAFDQPPAIRPAAQLFVRSQLPWISLAPDIPSFHSHMYKPDGTPEAPVGSDPLFIVLAFRKPRPEPLARDGCSSCSIVNC